MPPSEFGYLEMYKTSPRLNGAQGSPRTARTASQMGAFRRRNSRGAAESTGFATAADDILLPADLRSRANNSQMGQMSKTTYGQPFNQMNPILKSKMVTGKHTPHKPTRNGQVNMKYKSSGNSRDNSLERI